MADTTLESAPKYELSEQQIKFLETYFKLRAVWPGHPFKNWILKQIEDLDETTRAEFLNKVCDLIDASKLHDSEKWVMVDSIVRVIDNANRGIDTLDQVSTFKKVQIRAVLWLEVLKGYDISNAVRWALVQIQDKDPDYKLAFWHEIESVIQGMRISPDLKDNLIWYLSVTLGVAATPRGTAEA